MGTTSILITGGCGFIGTSLISRLLKENSNVLIRVLDNLSTGSREDLSKICDFKVSRKTDNLSSTPGVEFMYGDIRNRELVYKYMKGIDCIIHLAANTGVQSSVNNPIMDMESNVIGTVYLLEAAKINNVKSFVFASSGAPVGEVTPPIHEEVAPHPISPYGASKLSGEGYCSAYYNTYGIRTVCLRFGNVFGPGSKKKSSVIAKFIRETINGHTCSIYGDGTQTRDFLYIDDLVHAIILSMSYKRGGEIFQIATGKEKSIKEVVRIIKSYMKKYDIEMKIVYANPRIGDVKRNYSNINKAIQQLGWKPKNKFENGIEDTIKYFLNQT